MQLTTAAVKNWVAEVGRTDVLFLGGLTVGHLVVHWYTNLLSLVLPFIKEDLSLTDVEVGTVVTVQMGVNGAAILGAGFLADSFRKRTVFIISGAIVSFGIAFFVIGIAPSYGWTLVGAGMVGLGTALWHPATMGALSIRFRDRRGMALSVHGVGASIGDSIGPIIVGAIILVVSWRLTLELHLIPAVLFAFLLWRTLGEVAPGSAPRQTVRTYAAGIRSMLADRQVLAVMFANALINMGRFSMLAFFPIYLKETLDYSAFVLGVYLALLYVLGIVSQPVMGVVSDRAGRKMILVPSFFLMGLLYLAIVFVPGGWPLALVIVGLGLFFYAILNITQTAVMDVAAEGVQASTMGVMNLFSQPFALGSPVLVGFFVTEFGIETAFWYAAVAALLAAAVLVPVRFRRTF